jgi:succinate dehydrogenase / fumarate reductase flavoprotein subunit
VDTVAAAALAPFEHGADGHGPYEVQHELQELMQHHVGIVRNEQEMTVALEGIARLRERAEKIGVTGNRQYNPGWHTALDLNFLLTVSEAITHSALERKESRGGHFRDDFPAKNDAYATFNIVTYRGSDGRMQFRREPIPPMPAELQAVIQEMK